mmetsp:Transcript_106131/g.342689  ORF Transcript_106131/g.342689 Transcript_106131/m.342689 type:complete len:1100 (-) Transcript_106131:99-3398(-)
MTLRGGKSRPVPPLLILALQLPVQSFASLVCSSGQPLEHFVPTGCRGAELLSDPSFSSASAGWSVYEWESDGVTATFDKFGADVQVHRHPQPNKYDAMFFQTVDLDVPASGSSYSLCVRAGSSTAGDVLRFAVDGDEKLEYNTPGLKPRAMLPLPARNTSSRCFNFDLPGGSYGGRITIEFGDASGKVAICEATLQMCGAATKVPRSAPPLIGPVSSSTTTTTKPNVVWKSPACPAPAMPLAAFSCSGDDLSEELLGSASFSDPDAKGPWETHAWKAGAAQFSFGPEGLRVAVDSLSSAKQLYDVTVTQKVDLHPAEGPLRRYELCVQAGAVKAGTKLRFAFDSGDPLYAVPDMQERHVIDLKAGGLSTECFHFGLDLALQNYSGRVSLELGGTETQLSLCQVSLRSCRQTSYLDGALDAVRRCYVSPLQAAAGGCSRNAALAGDEFGLNSLGQETDGKQACLERLRRFGGNSFSFSPGRCELWTCPSREALLASASGSGDQQVYSQHCDYQENVAGKHGAERRTPVFVKLWEWNFNDIARECEEYLGPNGFDAVQVAPVVDHIKNGSWYAKYQPVSFLLDSRSGSAEEFKCMVATCRAVGVEVIVDVILNHIARPCDAVGAVGAGAVTPCDGWSGSRYGNRRLADAPGWKPVSPNDFHHKSSDRLVNCAVDSTTFQCPDSTPPGDCTQCDLFGLPDWDTEQPSVQELLTQHLKELHSIGVTMLRLDAASYIPEKDLSLIINQVPWDFVFQEWWAGAPAASRTRYVGHYRDIFFGRKINKALVLGDVKSLPTLLDITHGMDSISHQKTLYPLTFHDQRSYAYDPGTPTYKGGLEFHLQQKFLLASPHGHLVRLWGGFGWTNMDDGPPGCPHTVERCDVVPVYNEFGGDRCMETPVSTPLDKTIAQSSRWVCEHRWQGMAGLVGFRKACTGLPVTQMWKDEVEKGNLAWRSGDSCFVALQRKLAPKDKAWGDWSLAGLDTGLPEGRYCDLASVATWKGWDGRGCPREVVVGPDGVVQTGIVPEGDLVALHAGARLGASAANAAADVQPPPRSITHGKKQACAVMDQLPIGGASGGRWRASWLSRSFALASFLLMVLPGAP